MRTRWYAVTQTKGGIRVPLKVWFAYPTDPVTGETLTERPALWRAIRDSEETPIEHVMLEMQDGQPLIVGEEIDEDEYEFLTQRNAHKRQYEPDSPEANPRKPINLNAMPPIRWTP